MSPFSFLLLLFIAPMDGARHNRQKHKEGAQSVGRLSHLFTWGAPHPSNPMLTKKGGGCFAGYRITAFEWDLFVDDEDIVPTLLVPTSYNHPNIQTLVVMKDTRSGLKGVWGCGKNPIRLTNPHVTLHFQRTYEKLMAKISGYDRAKVATRVALMASYADRPKAIRLVEAQGWNLAGSARNGEDVSHLIQDPKSLRCILTFEGSDNWDDWITDAAIVRVSFCGLRQSVHLGFRNELRRIVGSNSWQDNVRPKLGKCSSVDVVGHSLGGAVATLFMACMDDRNGSPDYKNMSFTKQKTELMDPLK